MKVKVTTLYCVICSLANILHVYQICDEYLRYDVTTNVQVSVPDEIPFPSITLCVDLIDSLNWSALSNETIRNLFDSASEKSISQLVKDRNFILKLLQSFTRERHDLVTSELYDNLILELSVSEIINISAFLSDIIDEIMVTKFLYNVSQLMTFRKEERVSEGLVYFDINELHRAQFTIDMTYIHLRQKCIVMRPKPELQNINYDDQFSKSGTRFIILSGQYNRPICIYVLSHGYLITPTDTFVNVKSNRKLISSFVTHSSTLLEYPYKTNCRDYSKTGIMSRSLCRQQCFKTLSMKQFKDIPEESYAFQSDIAYFQSAPNENESLVQEINESLFENILEQCKETCLEVECQSLVYIQSDLRQSLMTSPIADTCSLKSVKRSQTEQSVCKKQKQLEKSYLFLLVAEGKPGTRTETQPAIPLVSFLTGLFSTFGFWLGLSVFGSANFFQILWSKARKNKKLKPKTQQDVRIIRRQQPNLHSNSSWKQVKVSSSVHRLSARRICQ